MGAAVADGHADGDEEAGDGKRGAGPDDVRRCDACVNATARACGWQIPGGAVSATVTHPAGTWPRAENLDTEGARAPATCMQPHHRSVARLGTYRKILSP